MQFEKGAAVVTHDGEKMGTIDRVILSDDWTSVTHVVVELGTMVPEGRVVPVANLDHTTDEGDLVLSAGIDPTGFERFSMAEYRVVEPIDLPYGVSQVYPGGFALVPAVHVSPSEPAGRAPEPGAEPASERSALQLGAEVVANDGRSIGKVEQVVTDDAGRTDSLVTKRGWWVFSQRRRIPAGWIQSVEGDRVTLSLTRDEVERDAERPTQTVAQRPPGR